METGSEHLAELNMIKAFNPKSIAPPTGTGTYSHGVVVPPNSRLLYIAGQVGIRPDGSIGDSIEEQSETVWANLVAVLAEAGMGIKDIVKINNYLTRAENMAAFRVVRTKYLGGHCPASTIMVVQALAYPKFLVEVEAVAAKAVPVAPPPNAP